PSVSDESVDAIRDTYLRSPKKSVRACARELQLKKTTVHKVLKKRLRFTGYRLQLLHAIKETDKPKRFEFASDMLNEIENDQQFLKRIVFSEYERNSPKVNVWCALMHNKLIGPFFTEQTLYAVPQIQDEGEGVIFQQDGAPPHYANIVREFLDTTFPQRWIGRGGFKIWPPRSPDITPLDFFFRRYVNQCVYSVRINDIGHLKERIRGAIHSVIPDVLLRVWNELEYRLDVCRVINGSHIELH
ncbi:hypothetical protein C0J52_21944, partial [Blattella germanica]